VVQEWEGDVGEWTIGQKWSEVDSESLRRSAEIRLRDVCRNDAGRPAGKVHEGRCGRSIDDLCWIEGCTKQRQVSGSEKNCMRSELWCIGETLLALTTVIYQFSTILGILESSILSMTPLPWRYRSLDLPNTCVDTPTNHSRCPIPTRGQNSQPTEDNSGWSWGWSHSGFQEMRLTQTRNDQPETSPKHAHT